MWMMWDIFLVYEFVFEEMHAVLIKVKTNDQFIPSHRQKTTLLLL